MGNPWLVVCLSWILPGAGHFYIGKYVRGLCFLLLILLLYVLNLIFLLSEHISLYISFLLGFTVVVISPILICIDAYKLANKYRVDTAKEEIPKTKKIWKAIFLTLLLPGLGHWYIGKKKHGILYIIIFLIIDIFLPGKNSDVVFLILFRLFACIQLNLSAFRGNKYNTKVLVMFAVIFISIKCFTDFLIPYVSYKYLYEINFLTIGASMEPTLQEDDRAILNKIIYKYADPRVEDIIVFKIPDKIKDSKIFQDFAVSKAREKTKDLKVFQNIVNKGICKRIVAIEGENIQFRDNKFFVNGVERKLKSLEEGYIIELPKNISNRSIYPCGYSKSFQVPQDHYFVLGDNFNISQDSRYFGAIHKNDIKGKVVKIYWPLNRIGLLY